jgi:hypothetical protein
MMSIGSRPVASIATSRLDRDHRGWVHLLDLDQQLGRAGVGMPGPGFLDQLLGFLDQLVDRALDCGRVGLDEACRVLIVGDSGR